MVQLHTNSCDIARSLLFAGEIGNASQTIIELLQQHAAELFHIIFFRTKLVLPQRAPIKTFPTEPITPLQFSENDAVQEIESAAGRMRLKRSALARLHSALADIGAWPTDHDAEAKPNSGNITPTELSVSPDSMRPAPAPAHLPRSGSSDRLACKQRCSDYAPPSEFSRKPLQSSQSTTDLASVRAVDQCRVPASQHCPSPGISPALQHPGPPRQSRIITSHGASLGSVERRASAITSPESPKPRSLAELAPVNVTSAVAAGSAEAQVRPPLPSFAIPL